MSKIKISELLLNKFFMDDASPEEVAAIRDWAMASRENGELFQKAFDRYAATTLAVARIQALPEAAIRRCEDRVPKKRRAFVWRAAAWTAGMAAALLAGVFVSRIHIESRVGETTLVAQARQGQQIIQTLADGTVVELNSGSTVEYPAVFIGRERRVRLSGEAVFKVTHDEAHPFIVETYAYDVKVLGTEFDVVADEQSDEFSTMLINGSVAVLDKNSEELVRLSPSQKASKVGNGIVTETLSDVYEELLWKEDKISIAHVDFEGLMRRFERGFGVRIVIDCKPDFPDELFSYGKVRITDGVIPAFDHIRKRYGFSYEYDPKDDSYHIR